jgi:2-dehydro-3-deoxyphosphogluconate aldolase / (4S)-4-hydroxy-2-oxoglutarate aldolase
MTIDTIMRTAPVIPVLVIDNVADAQPIAEALVRGGLTVLEVTLRTAAALDVIAEMARVPGAIVGAGTVLNPTDLEASINAGARFIVSPGLTEPLGKAAIASGVPFLPGTANAGDIMRGLDMGLDRFKFFPATASGGLPALKSLAAVFGSVRFCPTGGITEATAPEWLAEPAIACVGGSWIVPKGPLDLTAIEANARAASALRPNP